MADNLFFFPTDISPVFTVFWHEDFYGGEPDLPFDRLEITRTPHHHEGLG